MSEKKENKKITKPVIIAIVVVIVLIVAIIIFKILSAPKDNNDIKVLDNPEAKEFNVQFTQYEERQLGTDVKELLNTVIMSAQSNNGNDEKLPDIVYFDVNSEGPEIGIGDSQSANGSAIISDSNNNNVESISKLRTGIQATHYYKVSFEYDKSTGFINLIKIEY